jgi:hypothetical protein
MSRRVNSCLSAIAIIAALLPIAVPASAESFTFEDVPIGSYPASLAVTDGSLTLTITPEGNPNGYLVINSEFLGVPLLGSRSLIGSNAPTLQEGFTPVRFSFSIPVGAITFAFGDSGGDADSPVTIQAFNNANVPLGSLNETYPASFDDGKTLSGNFPGASYFILSSGSTQGNSHSLFWEVTSVSPVPEPTTLSLLSIGVLGLAADRRREKRGRESFS